MSGDEPAHSRAYDGGESFYFFDIDDNLMFLPTEIVLTGKADATQKLRVSTGDFATIEPQMAPGGDYAAWELGPDAYVNFEDPPGAAPEKSPFLRDIRRALDGAKDWMGPSWDFFAYACKNERPTAYITARGHRPESIRAGFALLVDAGLIARMPTLLDIFPVGNAETRAALEADARLVANDEKPSTADYKRIAIRRCVERAVQQHGVAPPHHFGMSDDDPRNVQRIVRAMLDCKMREDLAHMRFFVINTHEGERMKLEILDMSKPAPRLARAPAAEQPEATGGKTS